MRERSAATVFMWIALAISIGLILGSLKYTALVASPIDSTRVVEQTVLVPEAWQIGAAVLIFVALTCATAATMAIWKNAPTERNANAQAEKAKRGERDARLKRLLASLDDEELDALEQGQPGDDGERLSLEALLRSKRG